MSETATIERLKARAKIVTALRAFFDGQGFVEVETPGGMVKLRVISITH